MLFNISGITKHVYCFLEIPGKAGNGSPYKPGPRYGDSAAPPAPGFRPLTYDGRAYAGVAVILSGSNIVRYLCASILQQQIPTP